MQPKILVSKNRDERDKAIWQQLQDLKITRTNPDLLIFEDEKIGIAQIKQLIKHLSTKPFGNTPKSAVLLNGSNISPDAQNALLKTLEEPPGESVILIGVDSENKLLSTVLSRCIIQNPEFRIQNSEFDLEKILNASIQERFEMVEKTEDKGRFLEELIISYREILLNPDVSSYSTPRVEFLEDLLQAQIWKESNVNIRTILEYLMLKMEGD